MIKKENRQGVVQCFYVKMDKSVKHESRKVIQERLSGRHQDLFDNSVEGTPAALNVGLNAHI